MLTLSETEAQAESEKVEELEENIDTSAEVEHGNDSAKDLVQNYFQLKVIYGFMHCSLKLVHDL